MVNGTDTIAAITDLEKYAGFFLVLLKTAAESTLKIYGQILVGMILSHPKVNFLNKAGVQVLSKLLVYCFLPQLVLLKFGSAINFNLLSQVLIGPVAGLCVTCFQFILGQLLFMDWRKLFSFLPFVKQKEPVKGEKPFPKHMAILTVTFNNYIAIPYAFIMALTEVDLFKDPDKDIHAIAFVTLYYIPVVALFFSFGFWMVQTDPSREVKAVKVVEDKNTPKWKKILKKVLALLKKFFPPVIIAMIIGFVIGIVPPLKDFLLVNPPPLIAVFPRVLAIFGGAVIPVAFLIAGANIGRIIWNIIYAKDDEKPKDDEKVPEKKGVIDIIKKYWFIKNCSVSVCIKSVAGKLIISPLVVFSLIGGITLIFPEFILADMTLFPLMAMAILIEASSPVTLFLAMLSSLYEVGEDVTSELLLLHHFVFPFTIIVLCVAYLWFFCTMSSPYGCIGF